MSTTIKEELFAPGDTPSGETIRQIGGLDRNGEISPVTVNAQGAMWTIPSPAVRDAFARMRSSQAVGLFDSKQLFAKDQTLMIESLTGSGTSVWSSNDSSVAMTLTTASGDQVIRQSKVSFPYQPGRGGLVLLTGVMGAPKSNVRQRWGLFDENDGMFFEQTGSGISVVRRTSTSGSPVDNSVAQASWNTDTLDGNGPSGLTLDPSKMNIYVIDFAWLGAGGARLGVVLEERIVYCHTFATANVVSTVFIKTPLLPIRYSITNTGTAASGTTLLQTCCAFFSEGGQDPLGYPVVASNATTLRTIGSGSSLPMVSVRLRSGFTKGMLIPKSLSILDSSKENLYFTIVLGGTVTGGAWSNIGLGSEVNTTATTLTGGIALDGGYLSSAGNAGSLLSVPRTNLVATGDAFAGTSDAITLVISTFTAVVSASASVTVQEIL